MATRKRSTRRRTTRRRTTRHTTARRRRPKLSTTLGSAAALLFLAVLARMSPWWRVATVVALLALAAGYLLWRRRADIDVEMRDEQGAAAEEPQ